MRRHPALHDLSRDHHGLLVACRAAAWALAGDLRGPGLERARRDLLACAAAELAPHLAEEEALLLPRLRRLGLHEEAGRLLGDHNSLRAEFEALEGDASPALLESVAGRLRDHVRFEERVVFPRLQTALPEAELEAVGLESLARRQESRPEAIGPRLACRLPG